MYRICVIPLVAVCVFVLALGGCTSPKPAPSPPPQPGAQPAAATPAAPVAGSSAQAVPAASKEALAAQWQQLTKTATREKSNDAECMQVAEKLAAIGEDALNPVLDTLGDAGSSPMARILAAMCLKANLRPTMTSRLLAMVKPGNDIMTRACATDLLGSAISPEVDAALNLLKTDPEPKVRFYALHGLAIRTPDGYKEFVGLWKQPDITAAERTDIVTLLANAPVVSSDESVLDVFHWAMRDQTMDESVRLLAIQRLEQVGTAASVGPLSECAEKDASETVKKAAKNAADAIGTRLSTLKLTPSS